MTRSAARARAHRGYMIGCALMIVFLLFTVLVKAVDTGKAPVKVQSTSGGTGLIGRARSYVSAVRAEMRRVTWPGRPELTNYSVAVVAMLIVFGVAVWLIDTGFVAALVAFTSLRG